MSHRHHVDKIPPAALYSAMGIVFLSLLIAIAGSVADIGAVRAPNNPPIESRDLVFETQPDDTVSVIDVESRQLAARLTTDDDGFARGVLRALARDRALRKLSTNVIRAQLALSADGVLSIRDTETERRILLNGFGDDNRQAFEKLLGSERTL